MGIIGSTLLVFTALGVGTTLTLFFETKFQRAGYEKGPSYRRAVDPDLQPVHPDSWLYHAGPVVALIGVTLATVVLPFGPILIGADLGIGLFYFIVVVDFVVLGIALGGWGGDTPHSVESCYRIVAQLIAYVIPLGLAIIGPIMMARSLSTIQIVQSQSTLWYIISQPLGFALYLVTGLMQVYRAPFLEPFAENLKHGVLSVYGGWKGLFWQIALSGVFFVVAAMGAVLFLGGWQGPWLPDPVWMLLKTVAMLVFMKWLGQRFKPLSTADMLALSWKILIPVGLLNVLIVGALILLGVGGK